MSKQTEIENARRRKKRMAEKLVQMRLQGMTITGTPRKYEIWPKGIFWHCRTQMEKHRVRQRVWRQRNIEAGLTAKGKPRNPNYHFWPELAKLHGRERATKRAVICTRRRRAEQRKTPLERAWEQFRSKNAGNQDL